jgi:hypothetical protein
MPMSNEDLFRAIPSIDSYNGGSNERIAGLEVAHASSIFGLMSANTPSFILTGAD